MVPEAKAVILTPDGNFYSPGAAITVPGSTVLATHTSNIFNSIGGTPLSGTLVSTVYKLSAAYTDGGVTYAKGDVFFGYTFTLNKPSQSLFFATLSGFGSFVTTYDAHIAKPGTGSGPALVSYDGQGTISELFSPALASGKASNQLLIFTTGTSYGFNVASVVGNNGTSESNLKVYTPFALTPEPGSIALACAGLPVLGLYQLRRRRRAQNA